MSDIVISSVANRICPYCGKSYYSVNYITSTAVYYPPVYKDGQLLTVQNYKDKNELIHICTCYVCGKNFSF